MADNSAISTGSTHWTKTGTTLSPFIPTDNVQIGTGTPSRVDMSGGDLYVTDGLEIDGITYHDGAMYTLSAAYIVADLSFSDSANRSAFRASSTQLALGLGSLHDNQLVITGFDHRALDHQHGLQITPTFFIHSGVSPATDATQYVGFYHDVTDGRIITGTGNLSIGTSSDSHSLTANGDLFVSGKLEVDGIPYFDSEVHLTQISTPGTTTDKLYNIGGSLYWSGAPVGGGGVTTFLGLTDTPSSYTTSNALLTLDGTPAPSAIMESTTRHWGSSNSFSFEQGTTLFTVSADCTIDQNLQISASPEFASLSVGTEAASRFTFGAGDLYVADQLEVDGISYFDGATYQYNSLILGDGVSMYFNTTAVGGRMKSLDSINQMYLLVGPPEGRHLILGDVANGNDQDYGQSTQTNPTLFIYSVTAPSGTPAPQYMSFHHDVSHGRIQTGTGNVTIGSGTATSATSIGSLCVTSDFESKGVGYFESHLNLSQISAPSPVTDNLYNVSGTLYWNGSPLASGNTWVSASNTGIDQVEETVDSFNPTDNGGITWLFNIIDNDDDTNHRAGIIVCSWDDSAGTVVYNEIGTIDAGTVDVTLSVDMSGATGDVRLRAVSTSDNWTVSVIRSPSF